MTLFPIPQADHDDGWLIHPGRWRGARRDGVRTANVSCPVCKEVASLSGHEIAADGTVTPSLQCPQKGCTFHEHVKLEGWTP